MVSRAGELESFWAAARAAVPCLPECMPDAWAFGATAEEADALLDLVLAGTKTAASSARTDYEAEDVDLPRPGDLGIVLDGADRPRVVIATTRVVVVPFDQVTAEHAVAEGEGDRTLASWRAEHERFWRAHAASGFAPDMPVVCEAFRVVHAVS